MNKSLFFVLVLVSFFCCKKEEKEVVVSVENDFSDIKKDSIKLNNPIEEFVFFVKTLEKDDWIYDIGRLEKVNYGLKKENAMFFEGTPFFEISFKDTHLNELYKSDSRRAMIYKDAPNFDYELFKSVENIWGYFYRNIEDDNLIEDGVIEQWRFKNEEDARNALKQIRKLGGRVLYFNTKPYFITFKNHLFIFHTRAMAFSYEQKNIFQKFLLMNNIDNE